MEQQSHGFRLLFNQLRAFHLALNIIDLTSALSNHFHVIHSVVRSETAAVVATLQSALFHCENLSGIHFLNGDGDPVAGTTISENPRSQRGRFFRLTTVTPIKINARLSAVSPFTVRLAFYGRTPLQQHNQNHLPT
jgi:hypothetical protein